MFRATKPVEASGLNGPSNNWAAAQTAAEDFMTVPNRVGRQKPFAFSSGCPRVSTLAASVLAVQKVAR